MNGYWQLGLIVLLAGVASSLFLWGKNKLLGVVCYSSVYYAGLNLIRSLQGNAPFWLTEGFAGKTTQGYVKIAVFVVAMIAAAFAIRKITKKQLDSLVVEIAGIFLSIYMVTTACIGIPKAGRVAVEFILAVLIVGIKAIVRKKIFVEKSETIKWNNNLLLFAMIAWIMLYVLAGPAEIYGFSKQDFLFQFSAFYPYMILYAAIIGVVAYVVSKYTLSQKENIILGGIVLIDVIGTYVQTMFLNSNMMVMEGIDQEWDKSQVWTNCAIWLVILVVCIIILCRKCIVGIYMCIVVALLQMFALTSVIATQGVIAEEKQVVTKENMYTLAPQDNIIIIMLDAYGTEVMDYVLADEPDFLEPMHDFTYYSNMIGRYEHTAQAVPYLLTGEAKEEYTLEDNANSTFIKDIKKYGYGVDLYSRDWLVTGFGDGVVDNITEENVVSLKSGKIVNQMIDCCRYRGLPYLFKNVYTYTNYEFDMCVNESKAYIWGTDDEFYSELMANKINIDESLNGTFKFYHLKGAHKKYFLKEDMTYDCDHEVPEIQWKACWNIVLEYMNHLRDVGLYDDSTIIVMADHGTNTFNRGNLLTKFNIFVSEKDHPIFFIKRPNEKHDKVIIDDKMTDPGVFEGTIMSFIDENNKDYGVTIWD